MAVAIHSNRPLQQAQPSAPHHADRWERHLGLHMPSERLSILSALRAQPRHQAYAASFEAYFEARLSGVTGTSQLDDFSLDEVWDAVTWLGALVTHRDKTGVRVTDGQLREVGYGIASNDKFEAFLDDFVSTLPAEVRQAGTLSEVFAGADRHMSNWSQRGPDFLLSLRTTVASVFSRHCGPFADRETVVGLPLPEQKSLCLPLIARKVRMPVKDLRNALRGVGWLKADTDMLSPRAIVVDVAECLEIIETLNTHVAPEAAASMLGLSVNLTQALIDKQKPRQPAGGGLHSDRTRFRIADVWIVSRSVMANFSISNSELDRSGFVTVEEAARAADVTDEELAHILLSKQFGKSVLLPETIDRRGLDRLLLDLEELRSMTKVGAMNAFCSTPVASLKEAAAAVSTNQGTFAHFTWSRVIPTLLVPGSTRRERVAISLDDLRTFGETYVAAVSLAGTEGCSVRRICSTLAQVPRVPQLARLQVPVYYRRTDVVDAGFTEMNDRNLVSFRRALAELEKRTQQDHQTSVPGA